MASQSPFDEVARRARILSPESYTLDGVPVKGTSDPAAAQGRPPIVWQLQHHLYQRCYLRRSASESDPSTFTSVMPTLATANPATTRWDGGWIIQRIDPDGRVLVARQGKTRAVWGGQFLSAMSGAAPQVGAAVSLVVPHESTTAQPGFYFAFGSTWGDELEELGTIRFYWNVGADEAPPHLRRLALGLLTYSIPYRLKVLATRELFGRPDAMVLYVAARYARVTLSICADAHVACGGLQGRPVPFFTKWLADGLAAAEDPGNGESFGMSRCRVAAEGLWNAFVGGATDEEATAATVRQHATRYGLDPDRPYLNPRSPDNLDLALADA